MGSRGTEGLYGMIEVAGENAQLFADKAHNKVASYKTIPS
jgi:hypothetical protein